MQVIRLIKTLVATLQVQVKVGQSLEIIDKCHRNDLLRQRRLQIWVKVANLSIKIGHMKEHTVRSIHLHISGLMLI